MSDEFDFGFSAVDETELTSVKEINETLKRLDETKDLILPFLYNMKDLKGDMIKWPEDIRKAQCQKMIDKIINT